MVIVSRKPRDGPGNVEVGEIHPTPILPSAATHRHSPGQGAPGPTYPPGGVPSHVPARRQVLSRYRPYDGITAVSVSTRFFTVVTALNLLLILGLLFLRLVVRHWCTTRIEPGLEEASHNATDGGWRLDPDYLRQLQRVTERAFLRRSMKQGQYYHESNFALMPTFSCPQKRRVGSTSSLFVLCMPQHLARLHGSHACGLAYPPDMAYEVELFKQFNIQSTIYDPSLPLGSAVSKGHPFVHLVGGGGAEPSLAMFMLSASKPAAAAREKSSSATGGIPFLRVSCYGCAAAFLLPVLEQPALSSPAANPSVGQIVLRLDRWTPPFDRTSRQVLGALEQAGYHLFHTEQVFDSWKEQSYLVSFIHQSLVFPRLLGVNHTWTTNA